MGKKMLLFIPIYNCEKQIIRVLDKLDSHIMQYITGVMVIDNGSVDGSIDVVKKWIADNERMPVMLFQNKENYSLGGSHKVAFKYAIENKYDFVIVLHGDDQGNIQDIMPYLESGEMYKYDSFLGSRFEKGSKLINYPKHRIWGNYVFNILTSIVLGRRITDLGFGLNAYSVEYLKREFYMGFADSLDFNIQMLVYGEYIKSKFKFFPATWKCEDQVSNAKFSQAFEILSFLLLYIFNKNKLFYQKPSREYHSTRLA